MADRFDEVGYGDKPIGFGSRPAIVGVDMQVGFTRPEWPMGQSPYIHRAVENAAALMKEARRCGVPVANCNVAWGSEKDMQYWKISSLYSGMFYGDPSTRFDDRIFDQEYDFYFTKSAPSAFFGTPLLSFLTKQQIDTVIVAGCMTSGCIRGTVNDSFSNGFRTIVPEECVGDMEEGPHWDNLRDVGRRYADVMKMDDVIEYIRNLA